MLILPTPSATFDDRLIQRSGSGETDVLSNSSGLVTPQDEDLRPLGSTVDLKHAAKVIASAVERYPLLRSRKECQSSEEEHRFVRVPPMIMARMNSSESGSNASQSPEFEAPEVTHVRAKEVYNLPNRHISIEIQEEVNDATFDYDDSLELNSLVQPSMGLDSFLNRKWTKGQIGKCVLRALFFLPWCIAVGGSIVVCPNKLDKITFQTGYLQPLFGIYRFAHWADRTFEHIIIFAAFIGFLAWCNLALGMFVGCAVGALAVNAWQDFRLDPNVPLGEDDRQSVYLSVTKFWLTDEYLNLRRENSGFLLDDGPRGKRLAEMEDSEEE